MSIISIIPARGGSKGIPMKNLVLLAGKPLIYYTITASRQARGINRTIVSTDDPEISQKSKKFGAEVIIRPKKLATDKSKIESVIEHVLEFLKENESFTPQIIVLLQNTSPLRNFRHIEEALSIFKTGTYDSLLSGYLSHYFLWQRRNSAISPVNYKPENRPNRQQMQDQFIENGAIYITKYTAFMKTKCRISGKIGFYEMPEKLSIQIDSMLDIKMSELMLKNLKNEKY